MGFPSFAGGELEVPGRHGLTLAILLSPNCGTCDELAPAVATVMADPPEDVRAVALIGGADRDAVEGFRENHRLDPRYSAFAPAATEMLNVQTIPTALVFDEEGKTLNKGVPNTLEQLEVLIAQTRDIDVEEPTDHAIHEQEQAVSAGR